MEIFSTVAAEALEQNAKASRLVARSSGVVVVYFIGLSG